MEMPAKLPRILIERAATMPDATAYEFMTPHGEIEKLTYSALCDRASRMARQLTRHQAGARRPAILLFPPGIDYLIALYACFLAGLPAVPAYPPDPRRPEVGRVRLQRMMHDLGEATVLTDEATLADWPPGLARPGSVLLSRDALDAATEIPLPMTADTALVQYTSGSTTAPKGVIVRHRNLEHNISAIVRYMRVDRDSRTVIWLPPYHDMGLIGGILTPLFVGFPARLMAPFEFLKRPLSWLLQIAEFSATVSGGPGFAYDLCVRHHRKAAEHPPLDLSRWQVAFNGAEPVRRRTMEEFSREFAPYGFDRGAFFPCYGLAEATLLVAGGHWDGGTSVMGERAACGTPLPDQTVIVLNTDDEKPVPDGTEGEIWVSGPSVTDGYWAENVTHSPFADHDGRRFLRTGDIGYLLDGELVVTGKVADVLLHHGTNHHAIDIEHAAVTGVPQLRPIAAAFAVERGNAQEIVVVVEAVSFAGTPQQIAAGARQRVLVATGLSVHTVVVGPPGTVPRTSSGKVQRQLCRARFLAGEYDAIVAYCDAAESDRGEPANN